MKDIFLISDKQENFKIFYSNLGHLPIHFSWGGGINEALQTLPLENPAFIFLVTDNVRFLHDWIDRITQKGLVIPVVCFTKYISTDEREKLWLKGVTDLVQLPKHYKEFEYIIKFITEYEGKASEKKAGFLQGRLQDFSLIELIQTFGDAGKNGLLKIYKSNIQGDVQFNRGQIANARLKNKEPVDSIITMASWFSGRFEMEPNREFYREKIQQNNQQIIAQCQDDIRKRNQLLRQLPDLNQRFFAHPDLNYEEVEPTERTYLLHFKTGSTLNRVIEMYTGHSLKILRRFKRWLDNQLLIDPHTYDKLALASKERENASGLKKMFSNLFSKSADTKSESLTASGLAASDYGDEHKQNLSPKGHFFNDRQKIEHFIKVMEEA